MGVSVPPWELAKQPEIWGAWAIQYQNAKANAAVMRQQIAEARSKNKSSQ